MLSNLLFTLLGALLGWIPSAWRWVRDRFTITGAEGITFVVRPHDRPTNAKFQCKILVDITNQRRGPVRIAAAYFAFDESKFPKAGSEMVDRRKNRAFPIAVFLP